MDTTKFNLIHFGDNCAPGILINDILKIKKKQLFMLGVYPFNDILKYLQKNNLHEIYDKKYLKKTKDNITNHLLYNFTFNHDYVYDGSCNIINYEFVKERFKVKIKIYDDMFKQNALNIFINFTNDVDNLNIKDFLHLYKNKIKFHLIIFTNNDYVDINNDFISVIRLKNSYENWWAMHPTLKNILYNEIYFQYTKILNNIIIKN